MSFQTRAQNIINEIVGRDVANGRLVRIADAFISYRPDILKRFAVDPDNPTNEEKARIIVEVYGEFGRSVVKTQAKRSRKEQLNSEIETAGTSAEADFD